MQIDDDPKIARVSWAEFVRSPLAMFAGIFSALEGLTFACLSFSNIISTPSMRW